MTFVPSATVASRVVDSSQVGSARRIAIAQAEASGLDESDVGRVAIVVTELATNLVKHTGGVGGEILLQSVAGGAGLEILAIDQGPGMENVARALQDGYSTTGTSGGGLGGIRRLSSHFDIFSYPGRGTAVLAQILTRGKSSQPTSWEVGGICVPFPGETHCGDLWAFRLQDGVGRLVTVDGLGHGLRAQEASQEAVRVFGSTRAGTLESLFESMHGALRKTRGAAVSTAEFAPNYTQVAYMGVGNVAAAVIGRERISRLVSMNGIVGHEQRKLQQFDYAFPAGSLFLMHSDGLSSRWEFDSYPGLRLRHPSLIAAVLYRDFRRGRDDVTVVIAKVGSV